MDSKLIFILLELEADVKQIRLYVLVAILQPSSAVYVEVSQPMKGFFMIPTLSLSSSTCFSESVIAPRGVRGKTNIDVAFSPCDK